MVGSPRNWNPVERHHYPGHPPDAPSREDLSPRAYAAWTCRHRELKGGVSTGYKTPKTTDLYDGITGFGGQGTSPFVGNPDLEPETSVNSEVALYWTAADARHNFNVTLFRNNFDDKIDSGEAVASCDSTGGVRPCVNLGDYGLLGYHLFAKDQHQRSADPGCGRPDAGASPQRRCAPLHLHRQRAVRGAQRGLR